MKPNTTPLMLEYGIEYVDWSGKTKVLQFYGINDDPAEQLVTLDKVVATIAPNHPVRLVNTTGIDRHALEPHDIADRQVVKELPYSLVLQARVLKDEFTKMCANIADEPVETVMETSHRWASVLKIFKDTIYGACAEYEGRPK